MAVEKPDFSKVWLNWSTGVDTPFWPPYVNLWEKLLKLVSGSLERAKLDGLAPKSLDVKGGLIYL
jgi:hypothetical protein